MMLKDLLSDWTEPEIAEYYLACILGFTKYDKDLTKYYKDTAGVFNTNNVLSSTLFVLLEEMVVAGILEKRDSYEYRWNVSFKETWEYRIQLNIKNQNK